LTWRWLDPSWLFGTLAVVLPILVHLWGRGQSREVVVASLRWFGDGVSTFAWRWRPSDMALLLVRCAIVVSLALALAQPRVTHRSAESTATWLVVEPAVLEQGEGRFRLEQLREELPTGEVRWLVPGAPPVRDGESPPGDARWKDDQWAALAAVDQLAPPGAGLVLLTRDRVAALPGARPHVAHDVTWVALETPGSVDWRVVEGQPGIRRESSAAATRFERGDEDSTVTDAQLAVLVEAVPERREDAEMAHRAIEVLQDRGWRVSLATDAGAQAMILLGAPADTSAKSARWVLVDGEGPERSCRGTVRPVQVVPRPFPMVRCSGSGPGVLLWSAPDGQPLMTRTNSTDRSLYRFSSRLHPSWSGLDTMGWADWLQDRWLHDGLLPAEVTQPGLDRRRSFPKEQVPRQTAQPFEAAPRSHHWPETGLWWLVTGLLLTERWMQRRRD
jgi:hypothetical protein